MAFAAVLVAPVARARAPALAKPDPPAARVPDCADAVWGQPRAVVRERRGQRLRQHAYWIAKP